jgi:adenosylcobinamide-GDP ribazoletransferase
VFAPLKWLLLSLQFATILPIPPVQNVTEEDMRRSVLFFPLIGLLLGALLWAVQLGLSKHMSVLSASVVSVTIYTLATGALHLDGLMDTADAIGSRSSRVRALEIMKDSRVGAMGAIAAVLALIGKVSAVSELTPHVFAPYLVVPMVSRLGMVWSMVLAPAARPEGLGAMFAKKLPNWTVFGATTSVLALCLCLLSFREIVEVTLYFILTTVGFTFWMMRRFGGTTGDTFGALNEILEWIGCFVFVVR